MRSQITEATPYEEKEGAMKPIPLTDPQGRVCAYLCGLCNHVHGGSASKFVRMPEPWQAEWGLREAERCCHCRTCGAELPADPLPWNWGNRHGDCATCHPVNEAQLAARRAEYDAEEARKEPLREAALAKALDRAAAELLRSRMSDISEECYCAGWLIGLEDILWPMLSGAPREFGMGEVSIEEVAELKMLSDKAGGWWRWDEDLGNVFVTLDEWKATQ